MIRLLVAAWLCCLGTLALADPDLPALHAVRGVAADDVLNLRAGPGTSHEIIGSLRPDARGIEVVGVSDNGRWLQVNLAERTAWASAFYLRRVGPIWSFGLPTSLSCVGTEPFWSLERDGGTAQFNSLSLDRFRYTEMWSGPAAGRGDQAFGGVWQGPESRLSATFHRETCSDGMSDRLFGLSVLLIKETGGTTEMFSGCCSLAP